MSKKDWVGTKDSAFKMLGASNHCDSEREENDFYATDPIAIDKLFEKEKFSNLIWECAVGQGHLAKRMQELGKQVICSDIIDRGYPGTIIHDFLNTHTYLYGNGDIITNPPYKYCAEFIKKALECVANGSKVAMFLKLQTLEGQKRYEEIFMENPPKTIYVFVKRIACAKNGVFEGSSAVCYAWFVWKKGFKGKPTIDWIF